MTNYSSRDKLLSKIAEKRQKEFMDTERDRKILWSIVLITWFILNAYVIRQQLNPNYANPSFHIAIQEWDGKWEEVDYHESIDIDGIYIPTKWKNPDTKKVYHLEHPDILKGIKKEKWARGISTLILGIPILIFNFYRNEFNEKAGLKNGIIITIILSLTTGLSSIAEILIYIAEYYLMCFMFLAPFIYWEKIISFFKGKKA